jgi:class 3 adenylate cyclase
VSSTIRNEPPDIVILDIMLPGKDGLEVLKEIRAEFSVAVIMLTAKGDDADRIVGLELGADDYLPKPFNPRELLARIKAVTRRIPSQSAGGENVLSQSIQRQLKAILSADVRDYSRLMSQNEMWTIQMLKDSRALIASRVRSHLGRVVDSPGDNLLAEFGSIVHAVECAVEIQKNLSTRNTALPHEKRMEYRIGLNLGDVVIDRGKLYGDGVNIAARLEKLADPGGIAISGTVFDEIENKLPLNCEYVGEHTVKNILKPVRVYRVRYDQP